jgi:hypothetical protein
MHLFLDPGGFSRHGIHCRISFLESFVKHILLLWLNLDNWLRFRSRCPSLGKRWWRTSISCLPSPSCFLLGIVALICTGPATESPFAVTMKLTSAVRILAGIDPLPLPDVRKPCRAFFLMNRTMNLRGNSWFAADHTLSVCLSDYVLLRRWHLTYPAADPRPVPVAFPAWVQIGTG